MSFSLFGGDQPSNTTVTGYGGSTHLNCDSAISSFLSGIGQTTDPVTGITGRTAQEAYDKYKATGASASQLQDFARRVGHF